MRADRPAVNGSWVGPRTALPYGRFGVTAGGRFDAHPADSGDWTRPRRDTRIRRSDSAARDAAISARDETRVGRIGLDDRA